MTEVEEIKVVGKDLENIKIDPLLYETNLSKLGEIMNIKGKPNYTAINKFYEQLETLVTFVRNLKGIKDMYKYNDAMQVRLNHELKELEFILVEMSATLKNIHQLKKQKTNVTKEVKCVKETHEKRKREEYQEMELVAAIYDKDLLRKWHVAKKASDVQTMENFINTLAGKKQAMDYVYKMALEKLIGLRKTQSNNPTMLQALFAKPLPAPVRASDSDPESFLNSTD